MTPRPKTILIVAGDPSGDLHGSHLIRALKRLDPHLAVAAVGGPLMRRQADEFLEDLAARGMVGFLEPLLAVPFFARLLGRLKRFMRQRKPQAVICVDYYGFNRRVLSAAKACSVAAYYYISPQVWASRPGRIKVLARLVRRMFVIFPFEQALYEKAGLPCTFIGHPLLDLMPPAPPLSDLGAPLHVGLLPGSRDSEIKRHLPLFLSAFDEIARHFPKASAQLFASGSRPDAFYKKLLGGRPCQIIRENNYHARARLDLAISSSGTATLENALLGVPMVVVYKMSWATYAVARAIIKVPYISMANLLAGRKLVPELIQHDATPQKVARAAVSLLENPEKLARLKHDLSHLRRKLGQPGAAAQAAQQILAELH